MNNHLDLQEMVREFAWDWLSEARGTRPSPADVASLARDIQHAITAWCDQDEQQADEQRQLRGYSDAEKARI